jgi:uncharacterized protein involved in exopolysaccharide biosynthesis
MEGSSVLEIRVNWSDPEMTMRIANTLVDVFIEQFKEFNRGRAHESRTYLDQQVQLVANQLKESEKNLVDFQKSTGIMTSEDQAGGGSKQGALDRLTVDKRQLELEYAGAMAQLAELDALAGDASAGKGTDNRALRAALMNPNSLLRMLMTQVAMIETDVAKGAQTLKDSSPLGSRASKEIEGIKQRIAQELTQFKADPKLSINDLHQMIPDNNGKVDRTGAAVRVKVIKEQLDNLEQEIGQAQKQSQTLPDELQRYMTLAREKRVNEELYTSLCQRLAGATVDENSDLCDVRVFDPAQLPVAPIKPKPVLLAGLGTFMGLLLGICFAFCLEYLNDSLRTSEEVHAYLGIPVLAEIPKVRVRRSLIHADDTRVRWRQIS